MMDSELEKRLQAIEDKLDSLARTLEEFRQLNIPRLKTRKKKDKLLPPTGDEVAAYRARFSSLYQRWMEGKEIEVHSELDGLDLDELRRFADSNNLNVTAKLSKNRLLELIAARFREKRQLHKSAVSDNRT
ncbi:MAG: hypothetical protein ACYDBH_13990 [Acidobacteriaceae bacterium]